MVTTRGGTSSSPAPIPEPHETPASFNPNIVVEALLGPMKATIEKLNATNESILIAVGELKTAMEKNSSAGALNFEEVIDEFKTSIKSSGEDISTTIDKCTGLLMESTKMAITTAVNNDLSLLLTQKVGNWWELKTRRAEILYLSILIFGLAFGCVFNVPFGTYSKDDTGTPKAYWWGQSVWSTQNNLEYMVYNLFFLIALVFCGIQVFALTIGFSLQRKFTVNVMGSFTIVAVTCCFLGLLTLLRNFLGFHLLFFNAVIWLVVGLPCLVAAVVYLVTVCIRSGAEE